MSQMEVESPGTWGLVPLTQIQDGRTPHKPSLTATQQLAPPAMLKGHSGAIGIHGQWATGPRGADLTFLRHPNTGEESQNALTAKPTNRIPWYESQPVGRYRVGMHH